MTVDRTKMQNFQKGVCKEEILHIKMQILNKNSIKFNIYMHTTSFIKHVKTHNSKETDNLLTFYKLDVVKNKML